MLELLDPLSKTIRSKTSQTLGLTIKKSMTHFLAEWKKNTLGKFSRNGIGRILTDDESLILIKTKENIVHILFDEVTRGMTYPQMCS